MNIGLFQPNSPGDMRGLLDKTRVMGHKANIVNWFHKWGHAYRDDHVRKILNYGALPMLTWEPMGYSLADIAAGKHDRYIRDFGSDIRDNHLSPLYIRFAHEMNGRGWYDWQVDGKTYRMAWERVHTLITNRAPWVRFVWCVNRVYPGSPPIQAFWPGSSRVRVVGIDAYNNPKAFKTNWRDAAELYGQTLQEIRHNWKGDVWICETGCVSGSRRLAWIDDVKGWSRRHGIDGLIYWNSIGSGDYRLSASELALFGDKAF